MATVLTITESINTLGQIEEKLGIMLSDDPGFFPEWLNLPATLSDSDRTRLDRIRQNYLYQSTDGFLLEETIKMVLLSPLLELAGFYQAPYKFRTEVSVEVSAIGDNDEVLRGRIDALVLQNRLMICRLETVTCWGTVGYGSATAMLGNDGVECSIHFSSTIIL